MIKKDDSRRIIAEIAMLGRKSTADKNDIIKEIRKNNTRKKKVIQALKRKTD